MNKTLLAILAVALIPTALAHIPTGTPNPLCDPDQNPHDYVGFSEVSVAGYGAGFVTVQDGNVEDCDGDSVPADADGDFEFGYGGAFLPADHHWGDVCVDDVVLGAVQFIVGADANGDGILAAGEVSGPASGCLTLGAAGLDGGWWVFILAPATAGHVGTTN